MPVGGRHSPLALLTGGMGLLALVGSCRQTAPLSQPPAAIGTRLCRLSADSLSGRFACEVRTGQQQKFAYLLLGGVGNESTWAVEVLPPQGLSFVQPVRYPVGSGGLLAQLLPSSARSLSE